MGASAVTGAHDGATHGIPDIHEREWSGGIRAHPLHESPGRTQCREVVANPSTGLHGERRLLQMVENSAHVVGNGPHDETIEESDVPVGTGPRQDPAGRQEAVSRHGLEELPFMMVARILGFDRRQGTGNPFPACLDIVVDGRAIGSLETVLHVPDLKADR